MSGGAERASVTSGWNGHGTGRLAADGSDSRAKRTAPVRVTWSRGQQRRETAQAGTTPSSAGRLEGQPRVQFRRHRAEVFGRWPMWLAGVLLVAGLIGWLLITL